MALLKVEFDSALCSIGQIGPLAVVVWRGEMLVDAARCQHSLIEREFKAGRTVGLIVVLEDGVSAPSEEVRKILAVAADRFAPHFVAQAVVVLGEGFRAAAVRGWITAVNLVTWAKTPAKSFSTPAEAVAWLRPKLGISVARELSPGAILDAIGSLRKS